MSEHVHDIELSWIPGVEPRTVTLRHSHATHPEEPHRHRWQSQPPRRSGRDTTEGDDVIDDVRFLVDVSSAQAVELTAAEVWPDGGIPEDVSAIDVIAAMQESGTVERMITDWGLDDLDVSVSVCRLGDPSDRGEWHS